MANSLTNVLDKILAQGLMVLREAAVMPRLVRTDYMGQAAQKGSTIDIPVARDQTVADVTPSPTYSSAASNTPGLVQVSMANWKKTDFFLTDKEMAEIDRDQHFVPMQTAAAAKALANDIDQAIHKDYKGVYGFVGTPAVVPFSAVVTVTDARKVLNQQLCPVDGMRRIVMDPTAEAQALQLSAYSDVEKTQDRAVKIEGEIGRKFGFDHFMSQNVQTHTAGTVASVIVGSAVAAGASTLKIAGVGALGTVVTGDVFTIAGDTQSYVITGATATITSAGVDFTIDPALKAGVSTEVITLKATHVVNLAFHRDAFAYVTRPLAGALGELTGGNIQRTLVDNKTGLVLRLEVIRQNKQDEWEFDVLYGTKLVRPELAARIGVTSNLPGWGDSRS